MWVGFVCIQVDIEAFPFLPFSPKPHPPWWCPSTVTSAASHGGLPPAPPLPRPVPYQRFQSDRKTRARQAMISIFSDQDHPNASTATLTDEATNHTYAVEVDSPFFQLSKESVVLAAETLGGGGGGGGTGNSGGMTARNTARSGMSGAPPGSGAAGNSNNKRRDLPKKAELLVPGGGPSMAAAAGGAPAPPLPETNAALLNFFPRAAGTYPCRVLVKRRTRYIVDIRCIEVTAVVDAPRNATALVFRAPAGQKITQEVRTYVVCKHFVFNACPELCY